MTSSAPVRWALGLAGLAAWTVGVVAWDRTARPTSPPPAPGASTSTLAVDPATLEAVVQRAVEHAMADRGTSTGYAPSAVLSGAADPTNPKSESPLTPDVDTVDPKARERASAAVDDVIAGHTLPEDIDEMHRSLAALPPAERTAELARVTQALNQRPAEPGQGAPFLPQ